MMKLSRKQRDKFLFISGYLDGILYAELKATGKDKEEYTNDPYNALLATIRSVEEAIEQSDLIGDRI
jgi:hypothetical protein